MGCDFWWWGCQPDPALQEKAVALAEAYYEAMEVIDFPYRTHKPPQIRMERTVVGPVIQLERHGEDWVEQTLDRYEFDLFGLLSVGGTEGKGPFGGRECLLFDRKRQGRLVSVNTLPAVCEGSFLNAPLHRRHAELAERGIRAAVIDGSFTRLGQERWHFALLWAVLAIRYLAEFEMHDDFHVYAEVRGYLRELGLEERLADEALDYLDCWELFVKTMREHHPEWFADYDDEEPEQEPVPLLSPEAVQLPEHLQLVRIDDLELSVRAANCLENAGVVTLADLLRYTDDALLRTRHFGRKSLREIQEILAELGLALPSAGDQTTPKAESCD